MTLTAIHSAERGSRRLLQLANLYVAIPVVLLAATGCIDSSSESGQAADTPISIAAREASRSVDPVVDRIDHSVVKDLPFDPSDTDPANSCGC